MCLHPNQATLIVGDQSGTIHVWDLTTDHNEQLVKDRYYTIERVVMVVSTQLHHCFPHFQIPEPDVAIHSVHIDPDGAYLAAVNSKVYTLNLIIKTNLHASIFIIHSGHLLCVELVQWCWH